jgi:hypothetical protein
MSDLIIVHHPWGDMLIGLGMKASCRPQPRASHGGTVSSLHLGAICWDVACKSLKEGGM